jgi:hypothetical protein
MELISFHSFKQDIFMIRTSSKRNKLIILRIPVILTPEIFPSDYAFLSRRLSPSITNIKSRGDKGHSFLSPRPLWKKGIGPPLIKIAKEDVLTQLFLQFVSMSPKHI